MRQFKHYKTETVETEYFQVSNDRRLAYARYGKKDGIPVLYFHGCPGSRLEAMPAHEEALKHGFEIFAIDRPGCGRSDFKKGYTILNWVEDMVSFIDCRGFDKVGMISFSGGGVYIEACANQMPERMLFAYDLGGFGPVGDYPELTKVLAPLDRFFMKLKGVEPLFRVPFSFIGSAAKNKSDQQFAGYMKSSMGEDDKAFILGNKHMASFFRAIVKESFYQGTKGPSLDAVRCYSSWGFDMKDTTFPVQIWHGTDDKFAHYTYSEFKHKQMKNSHLRLIKDKGHLHMPTLYNEIFETAQSILKTNSNITHK